MQTIDKWGRLPNITITCVGGGSNVMGIFHKFVNDFSVRFIGVEAGEKGVATEEHAATLTKEHVGLLNSAIS